LVGLAGNNAIVQSGIGIQIAMSFHSTLVAPPTDFWGVARKATPTIGAVEIP
jgi:hypothetical protein